MPDMPEWVQFWTWLRFIRDPPDLTPLPEQQLREPALTTHRYGELKREWVKAGQPSLTPQQVISVLIPDDEPLPF